MRYQAFKRLHQPLEMQLEIQIGGYSISDTVSEVSKTWAR